MSESAVQPTSGSTDITTWYLEMRDPAQLRPAQPPPLTTRFERVEHPSPSFSRFLYTAVGGHWNWRDRLSWSYARWLRHLDRPQLQTWVLTVDGTPAGYVELEKQADDVEITYFGLMREFTGRGLGGHLLTLGIRQAWAMGAQRVWVHTCSLDAPAALANYKARGMRCYKAETCPSPYPATPPGPWPGWDNEETTESPS